MGKYESSEDNKRAPLNSKKPMGGGKKALIIILSVFVLAAGALAIYISQTPKFGQEPSTNVNSSTVLSSSTDQPTGTPPNDGNSGRKEGVYTILLAGTNDDYNTDTIMLCYVDTVNDTANVVSIPRDTQIDIPSKYKRINSSYGRAGMDELCTQIKTITGVTVDYYCLVDLKNFVKVVDLIGGVEFNVPYNMHHTDQDPSLSINLKKGVQTLNGAKALQLVRYRGTSASDFGRTQMQRDFLLAVCKKLVQEFNITQINKLLPAINESLKTNMPVNNMLWFYINFLAKMDLNKDIQWMALPYESTGPYKGQDYVYLSAEQVVPFVNEYLNPYNNAITEDDVHIVHFKD